MNRFPFSKLPYFSLHQKFDNFHISDIADRIYEEMESTFPRTEAGKTVAITAGSRGIHAIDVVLKTVVRFFTDRKMRPFLVPAMGSHGGASPEGQLALLEKYGITEQSMGCPIRSSMETKILDSLEIPKSRKNAEMIPIHFDKIASEADGIFVVNRIKSHTRFCGAIESGLCKMMMIGLGKAVGASLYHRAVGIDRFEETVRKVVAVLRARLPFLGGLGIVENAQDRIARIQAVLPEDFEKADEELLVLAKKWMPRLPFGEIDLVFLDRIGKEISGTGFDPNVLGRKFDDHKAVPGEKPVVHCIAVRRLSPQSGGNANGIGMCEFCTRSVLREMDREQTRINAITANHVSAAMIPLDYETEGEIILAASKTLGHVPVEKMKILRIQDTRHLETLLCSEGLREEIPPLCGEFELQIREPSRQYGFFEAPFGEPWGQERSLFFPPPPDTLNVDGRKSKI